MGKDRAIEHLRVVNCLSVSVLCSSVRHIFPCDKIWENLKINIKTIIFQTCNSIKIFFYSDKESMEKKILLMLQFKISTLREIKTLKISMLYTHLGTI